MLRQHGWSGTAIGLIQSASLPTVFKFVFALPLDRPGRPRGNYRVWAIFLLLTYAAVLGALGIAAAGVWLLALGTERTLQSALTNGC